MPIVRQKWDEIPDRQKRNEHYGKEEFEQFQDELEALAEKAHESLSADEFAKWLANNNLVWAD
jgi:hypothetical protein